MNTVIDITIRDRVPYINGGEGVITYNSDYIVKFDFDNEWSENVKTVYFAFEDGTYKAAVIDGTTCVVPAFDNSHKRVFVGVQAGDIRTTRPCCLKILDSIADYVGETIPDPTEDVYQQIINLINAISATSWDTLENKPFTSIGSGLKVEDGTLTATAQGGGADITITDTAEVGEVLTVEEVDSEGKPTKWKTEKPTEQKQADWEQNDETAADYIKNKPTIPDATQIDTSLTKSGQAADAKAVGDALDTKQAAGDYLTSETDPTVPTWAKQSTKPTYTASEVGAVATAQGTDNSGKYLGVDSDGNVTTVDAPSGGGEQVQSNWYELDTTSAAYIRNKPFSDTVTDITGQTVTYGGHKYLKLTERITNDNSYIYVIGDDASDDSSIFTEHGLTCKWYDSNTYNSQLIYAEGGDYDFSIIKVYRVDSSATIPWRYLPTVTDTCVEGSSGLYKGIFSAKLLETVGESYDSANVSPCYYAGDTSNGLVVRKEVKTYSALNFNEGAMCLYDTFQICLTSGAGTASESLGLTDNDYPVMSYLIDIVKGSGAPIATYYIETAANKRFKATYRYGTTTWTSVVNLNGDSSNSETPLIVFGCNDDGDVYYYDWWNDADVDEATLKTTLGESPWKIWFETSDYRLLALTKRDYDNEKLYFADYANCAWHVISNIGTNNNKTYTPTYSREPMAANLVVLNSSTSGSTKKFKLTVDDSGTISATEVTE